MLLTGTLVISVRVSAVASSYEAENDIVALADAAIAETLADISVADVVYEGLAERSRYVRR